MALASAGTSRGNDKTMRSAFKGVMLAAGLALLARDPALCRRLGDQARIWAANNLSWERHCRLVLHELPASRPAPSRSAPALTEGG